MAMNTKKLVIGIIAALLVWTGVETYRYWRAKQQLTASLELQRKVETKLTHLKNLQLAAKPPADAKP